MIEEEGLVLEVTGEKAKVAVLKKSACESCAAAGICHPHDDKRSYLEAANPLEALPGQKVKVAIKPLFYFRTSALVRYGIPGFAFVLGAILTKNVSSAYGNIVSDMLPFIVGVCSMIACFMVLKFFLNNKDIQETYQPVIVEILSQKK
ncbi:MAG: SoxR reducing system RseC family protein [Nitrospirota bacterium]